MSMGGMPMTEEEGAALLLLPCSPLLTVPENEAPNQSGTLHAMQLLRPRRNPRQFHTTRAGCALRAGPSVQPFSCRGYLFLGEEGPFSSLQRRVCLAVLQGEEALTFCPLVVALASSTVNFDLPPCLQPSLLVLHVRGVTHLD